MFDRSLRHRSRLGQLLVKKGIISSVQLADALAWQNKRQIRLGTALLELGLVDKQQLEKALRRQVWIRRLAAIFALISTPFTPAIAAGSSGPGTTSSASARITLTVLPKTLSASRDNVTFKSTQPDSASAGLCISPNQTPLYRIKAQDLSRRPAENSSRFSLQSSESETKNNSNSSYSVELVNKQIRNPLSNNQYSVVFQADRFCNEHSQQLNISMSDSVRDSAPVMGKLRLTISPE